MNNCDKEKDNIVKNILITLSIMIILSIAAIAVFAEKPTTTISTTTTSITSTTLSPINPELRYLEGYPILRQVIKNRIITYLNNRYDVCILDINLNPDHLKFRFRDSSFYAVEVTMCDGQIFKMIKQRQTFRERFLT